MAYISGTATSQTDLLSALQSACTGNGWTLSGAVLHKGTCYLSASVVSGYLVILGGTGIDGSNNLTGAGPYAARIGVAWPGDSLTFPVAYAIHVGASPDEIYLLINYEVNRWQWLAFGASGVSGLPGTGNWYGAFCGSESPTITELNISATNGSSDSRNTPAALFFGPFSGDGIAGFASFIHHGLYGGGWSGAAEANASAFPGSQTLLQRLPNLWNGETSLLPIQPCVLRPSYKVSIVGDLAHARYLRNDNYAPGDLITLGADRWKVYPWASKNAAARDGGSPIAHSGTLGWAIRYDGA